MLWCPVVDGSVHRANPRLRAARQVMETDWEMFSETVAHSLVGWSESDTARRFARLVRAGITQDTIRVMVPALHRLNVCDELPKLRCPTLVMHRPDLPLLPPGTAERVAAMIPNARLALFEGSSSVPFVGDWRAISRAVADFLGLSVTTTATKSGRRALRLLSMKDESLTPRERQVVELVVRGLTNRQIAQELFLAEKTVGNHVGRILVKLDLRSRTQLAAYAVERRLVGRPA
jgi:DNA-binding CsgD family transcriptional regulator